MRIPVMLVLVTWAAAAVAAEPAAQPAAGEAALRRQRDIQERARALATELMGNVLDQQLRRLEENGLANLPVHAEIQDLRGSIEALAAEEMQEVVDLLAEADSADGPARDALVRRAQRLVRRISVQLAAEQRQLLRRLKIADLAAQVRRLARSQETVLGATDALGRQPDGQRESATVAAIEQQKTVKALFAGLVDLLEDVRGWEGSIGSAAAEGLRSLRAAKVAAAFDTAEDRLGAVDVPAATEAQRTVLAALESLLKTIERAQGLGDAMNGGQTTVARQLLERARQQREKIAASRLDDRDVESLANEQSRLRDALRELATADLGQPEAALAERAGDSVAQSIEKIFEAERQEAVARQDKAVDALEDLVQKLEQSDRADSGKRSSVELARRLDDIRKAAEQVAQTERAHDAAVAAAEANPPAAAAAERQIGKALEEIERGKDLPQSVRERLEEAARAAEDAGEELAEATSDPAERQEGKQAAEAASQAASEAAQEIAKALAETERQQFATKVDELSKAADAIERAAAKERSLAEQAAALGEPNKTADTTSPDAAAGMAQAQRDVSETVERVAEGVRQTAPDAAKALADSEKGRAAAQKQFDRMAGEQQSGEQRAPSGEQPQAARQSGPRQPAEQRQAAAQAAAQAEQAAEALKKAASELRREAAAAAEQLAESAGKQNQSLSKAQESQPGNEREGNQDSTGSEQQQAGKPQQAGQQQQAGGEDLQARQAAAARDQAIAEDMQDRLGQQEQARRQIEALGKQLVEWAERLPPELQMARGQRPGEEQARGVALQLFAAQREYARAHRDVGGDAETVSGQGDIADRPLREGLDRASDLKLAERDEPQPGDDSGSSNADIEQGSPEDSARMITGTRAQQIAESLLDPPPTSLAMSQQSQQSQSQQSQSQQSQSQQSQSQQSQSQQSQSQQSQSQQSQSQQSQSQQSQRGTSSDQADAGAAETAATPPPKERSADKESWFAKLPPAVRDAIRAKSQRRAPRGYEEKLDRYFKNID